ncbi:unnamed protein product [Adineta ricciae]|uniref:SRCR domain-containing protein n=1 Tax=Adineta ricciae TaxID=249248 RepID=A0A814XBG4_ADIRI|nr:unnamed protein product [Adineta ricciae]CAF1540148.1 unnamed protein product [Adineta ricciae]
MHIFVFLMIEFFYLVNGQTIQDTVILNKTAKSIDQTCNNIHTLLTYQRKIVNIHVTKEAPVRIKIDMELTSPLSSTSKHSFSVEGMVCHHGFDRNAAQAACRSQKKNLQMFSPNYQWEPSTDDLYEKCYFQFNNDPFIVPCQFVLDNFNCTDKATSLNDCTYSSLFQHQCTNEMHVGIMCSGIYEPSEITTTTSIPQTLNCSTTTFLDRQSYPTGSGPTSIAQADLNNDSYIDLVVTNTNSFNIGVFINNGDGTFQAQNTYEVPGRSETVRIADFDHNGVPDIAVSAFFTNTIDIFSGIGDGTFQLSRKLSTDKHPHTMLTGDFNADNLIDIVVSNLYGSSVGIFLANRNGTFEQMKSYPSDNQTYLLAVEDFNGDRNIDILAKSPSGLFYLLGDGHGTFNSTKVDFGTKYVNGVGTGDFNGDTHLDLAITDGHNVRIYIGFGNGTYIFKQSYATAVNAWALDILVTDLNVDHKLDLVVQNSQKDFISIWFGNGNATFQKEITYPLSSHLGGPMIVADLNKDFLPDIAALSGWSTTSSLNIFLAKCA